MAKPDRNIREGGDTAAANELSKSQCATEAGVGTSLESRDTANKMELKSQGNQATFSTETSLLAPYLSKIQQKGCSSVLLAKGENDDKAGRVAGKDVIKDNDYNHRLQNEFQTRLIRRSESDAQTFSSLPPEQAQKLYQSVDRMKKALSAEGPEAKKERIDAAKGLIDSAKALKLSDSDLHKICDGISFRHRADKSDSNSDLSYRHGGTIVLREGTKETIVEREAPKKPDKADYENSPELKEQKAKLEKLAGEQMSYFGRRSFVGNMEAFEERAKQQGLGPKEIAETYKQLSRILSSDQPKVDKGDMNLLARGLMAQLADPTTTDQGFNRTCSVTALGEKMLTRSPAKVAEMIASSAIEGQWKAPDGKLITIPKEALHPGLEERYGPSFLGARSFATQILNHVMLNDHFQRIGATYLDDKVIFNDGEKTSFKGLSAAEVANLDYRYTGERNNVISRKDSGIAGDIETVNNLKELEDQLSALKRQGRLPVIIDVDASRYPFSDPTIGWIIRGLSDNTGHVVSITDYDPKTGMVSISNQWGKRMDYKTQISFLFNSMKDK